MQMSLTVEERLDRIEQLLRGQKNVLNFDLLVKTGAETPQKQENATL